MGFHACQWQEWERRQREAQRRLHRFEVLAGTERDRPPRADPERAVKEYSRPAAGKETTRPSDLRPPDVLYRTTCYLIDQIASSDTLGPWTEVYDFVFDRLRSVRQDMIVQRVGGETCVAILERTVRFLLYASHRLSQEPLRLYDPQINHTHLQESLSWLLGCYREEPGPHGNEEEFQALCLLYNLGSPEALQHALLLPPPLRRSRPVSLALEVNRAYLERNYVRLFRLARRLGFLQGCALWRHLGPCRRGLLLLYSHGHSSRQGRYPLGRLAQLVGLERGAAEQLCRQAGVEVKGDCAVFSRASFRDPGPGADGGRPDLLGEGPAGRSVASIVHGTAGPDP
nr:PREDICTED: SAC3 domain-containing protein 1 [Lepisosteus oculatus]